MYALIDMDAMQFLGLAKNYREVTIAEKVLCGNRKEPVMVLLLDRKADWTALTELEVMMLGEKYGLDMRMGMYIDNLNVLREYAQNLNCLEFSEEQLRLFDAPARALREKYDSSEGLPASPRSPVGKPQRREPADIKPPSPKGATGLVWSIADKVLAEVGSDNMKNLRMAVIQTCVDSGIHPATAATQWSKWKKERGL